MAASGAKSPPTITPTITATQHGGYIRVAAALALVCMLLFLIVRLVVRRPWNRLFGPDDWATIFSSGCALIQSIVLLCCVNTGLGTVESELTHAKVNGALKLLYTGDLLFVLTIFSGEVAVAFFFLRLAGPNRNFFHQSARVIAGITVVVGVISLLLAAIRVGDVAPWWIIVVGHKTMLYRWIAIGIMTILIEISLIICPAWLFWTLQMPLQKKLGCSVYFALRFPTMVLTILRLVSLAHANKGSDPTFDMTMPAVLQQLEMHFTVLSCTIPILRNPLTKLNTGYLNTTLEQMDPAASAAIATKGSSSGRGGSYALSSIATSKRRDSRNADPRLGRGGFETVAEAGAESTDERDSIGSDRSSRIIIKRTVQIDYGMPR